MLQRNRLPSDPAQFEERRRRFMEELGDGVALVAASAEMMRNNDVAFDFRQDSDFFFLTGFDEPDAVAMFDPTGDEPFTLFVRPRDRDTEIWTGYRAGVEGAKERYGADAAYEVSDFPAKLRERMVNRTALYSKPGSRISGDVERTLSGLGALRERFGKPIPAVALDPTPVLEDLRLHKSSHEIQHLRRACEISVDAHIEAIRFTEPGMHEYEVQAALEYVFRAKGSVRNGYPSIVASGENACVLHYIENDRRMDEGDLLLIDAGCEYGYFSADITRTFPVGGVFTAPQRAIYEVVLAAQRAGLAECHPGSDLKAVHEAAVRVVTEGLVDLGLIPGSVDDALEMHLYREFFMHGTSHWLGMDVHDCGSTRIEGKPRPLEIAMAFTVEPGIYVNPDRPTVTYTLHPYDLDQRIERRMRIGPPAAKALEDEETAGARSVDHAIPEEFLGIGIRIEDDVLVTEEGFENLSEGAPVTVDDIEALWAESSWLPPR